VIPKIPLRFHWKCFNTEQARCGCVVALQPGTGDCISAIRKGDCISHDVGGFSFEIEYKLKISKNQKNER